MEPATMQEPVALTAWLELAQRAQAAGCWDQALAHFEAAFAQLPAEGNPALAAKLLRKIGVLHRERGDLEVAEEVFEAALAVAEAAELPDHVAAGLNALASVHQLRGELVQAESLYQRAYGAAERSGYERMAMLASQNLGIVANIRGDVAMALDRYRSALDRSHLLGDALNSARVLNNMGMAHVDLGEWEAATRCFGGALESARHADEQALVGTIEINQAELFLKRQRYEDARASCDRALQIFSRLRSKSWLAEAYKLYGVLYRETGKLEAAGSHFALAIGLAEAAGNLLLQAETRSEWALLHVDTGEVRSALRCFNQAYTLFSGMEARLDMREVERGMERLGAAYLPVVSAWGSTELESKHSFQRGHIGRVADHSQAIGQVIGLSQRDLTLLRVGASVHEIGNTVLPANLLGKPGRFTRTEWQLVQSHTVIGDAIVGELEFAEPVRAMVRHHHERWDGAGYPDGLAGNEIPVGARILNVANVFTALTTDRPYRSAFSEPEAIGILRREEAGRTLDPTLVEAFCDLTAGAW